VIDISKDDLDPKIKMTINMGKGFILALFVILNYVYFNLNSYVFLGLFIGLIVVMEVIFNFMKKKFYW
jgi:hypothetical protein